MTKLTSEELAFFFKCPINLCEINAWQVLKTESVKTETVIILI